MTPAPAPARPSRRTGGRIRRALVALGIAAGLGVNAGAAQDTLPMAKPAADSEGVWIGLAFSGGGTRATAFDYGVLRAIGAEMPGDGGSLLDRVRFVSGVSGGAVMAAAFALHGPAGLEGFREGWLLRDGERYMVPGDLSAREIMRGFDAPASFGRALDEDLFHGATFADLGDGPPMLRIVASDTASAAPFVFDAITFGALCTDLSRIRLADALAASAAVPVVFAAVPVARYQGCHWSEPPAYTAARTNAATHPAMRLLAQTVARYADPAQVRGVRLLDGSMTDFYGVSGFLSARAGGGLAPMTNEEALRTREILFLTVDAALENWTLTDRFLPTGRVLALSIYGIRQRLSDDGGGDLDAFLAERAITATTTGGTGTLRAALDLWRQQIIAWRCDLAPEILDALWPDRPADWDCRDLTVHVGEIGLDGLPEGDRQAMNDISTRLRLPAADVDRAITSGILALGANRAWQDFRAAMRGG
ncbi:MAG: patatin-like phospholipase family protein [Rubellimicrobium sp.]|nr:patatin-like phospholipase family protein [Rubellimicrobium sp.]